jgi:hypothetical protein
LARGSTTIRQEIGRLSDSTFLTIMRPRPSIVG